MFVEESCMRSRRIVFKAPKQVEIEEVDIPSPSPDEVLVKTLVTLISTGTELTMFSGQFPEGSVWERFSKYPTVPGYSNCGIVKEVGENVKDLKVGDRVLSWSPHAEHALTKRTAKVPEGVSDEEATFGSLATTVLNGVRLAHISLGECVVIVGAGILGQLAAQFSRLCGGFPVIVVDLSEKRLRLAEKLGATAVLQSGKDDVAERIMELSKGRGADVVFEVTGNPKIIPWELSLVKKQGRFIVLSSPRGPTTLDFHDYVNWPSRIIIGTHMRSHPACETPFNPWTQQRNTELFFDLVSAGLVNVKELITNRYAWTEAGDAYRMLLKPTGERLQVMGVLLEF
jgi:2-desacetyl-2-hydroxyethyl bacteriochlorophyllide A dehydrogenase